MDNRRARLRRKIYDRLPKWLKRHDFEVFAAVLSIIGGLPILFGEVEPQSPEEVLPPVVVYSWAATLVLGGIFVLAGIVRGVQHRFPERIFWMRVEALGLTALAYFSYIYTVCILAVSPRSGWAVAMIVLAFGGTCHVRSAAIRIEIENYRMSLGLEGKA